MRKLVCLSMCSVHQDLDQSQASEQSILRVASPSRRVRRITYIRPSPRAIRLSSVLLCRFPNAFPILNSQQSNSAEAWKRQYQTDESISSTPLGPWADALPVKFNTVWDMLAFESNGVLSTDSSWRSPEQEFWMPGRSLGSTTNSARDNQTKPDGTHNSPVISEGVCRTMLVVTSVCQDQDMKQRLLGSIQSKESWNSMFKLIFSFRTRLYEADSGIQQKSYQHSYDDISENRLRASEELFLLVSDLSDEQLLDYVENNPIQIPIFEECLGEWLRSIDQGSLSLICEVGIASYTDSLEVFLFVFELHSQSGI